MTNIKHWLVDYMYLVYGHFLTLFHRKTPKHFLNYVVENKAAVILIPGFFEKWTFLKKLADKISLEGHPLYIVSKLGYNLKDIPTSAKVIKELIDNNNIQNAIIVAHSKGGLIGKYYLINLNKDNLVKGMVSIATPYSGTSFAHYIPHSLVKDFRTDSKMIQELKANTEINKKIISISPVFDNHVWEGSRLEGAQNITVNEKGHHKIIYNKELQDIVIKSINKLAVN